MSGYKPRYPLARASTVKEGRYGLARLVGGVPGVQQGDAG